MGLFMDVALFCSGVITNLLSSRIYDDFMVSKTQSSAEAYPRRGFTMAAKRSPGGPIEDTQGLLGGKEVLELLNGHPLLYPED